MHFIKTSLLAALATSLTPAAALPTDLTIRDEPVPEMAGGCVRSCLIKREAVALAERLVTELASRVPKDDLAKRDEPVPEMAGGCVRSCLIKREADAMASEIALELAAALPRALPNV